MENTFQKLSKFAYARTTWRQNVEVVLQSIEITINDNKQSLTLFFTQCLRGLYLSEFWFSNWKSEIEGWDRAITYSTGSVHYARLNTLEGF